MKTDVKDSKVGISLRFIREWKPDHEMDANSPQSKLWTLAMADTRDVPFMQKLFDARDYLREQHDLNIWRFLP